MSFFHCTEHAALRYQMRINRRISSREAKSRVEEEMENMCDLWGKEKGVQIYRHRLFKRRFKVKGRAVLTVERC